METKKFENLLSFVKTKFGEEFVSCLRLSDLVEACLNFLL